MPNLPDMTLKVKVENINEIRQAINGVREAQEDLLMAVRYLDALLEQGIKVTSFVGEMGNPDGMEV